ncbi:MAG TPA: hypothetical protein VMH86_04820 [Rhizomicrobium sp.]|nr:hypothetical protein [Rhizomicrobium sp.]
MTELDLINLSRSITENEVSWFAQVITLNFAMVVAIYYFLHRAQLAIKLFAFFAYMVGSLFYFAMILFESNLKYVVTGMIAALPAPSKLAQEYAGLAHSWLGTLIAVLFTGSFWILWLGVLYLLFFWRRGEEA